MLCLASCLTHLNYVHYHNHTIHCSHTERQIKSYIIICEEIESCLESLVARKFGKSQFYKLYVAAVVLLYLATFQRLILSATHASNNRSANQLPKFRPQHSEYAIQSLVYITAHSIRPH